MNTNDTLCNLIEDQERLVTELREQLAFENARLKRLQTALDVLSELDSEWYGPETRLNGVVRSNGYVVKLPR